MANARVTFGHASRMPGTVTGINVNTFGLDGLIEGIDGERLAEIAEHALEPSYQQAKQDWPILTGASNDSIRIETTEVGSRMARVGLMVGGEPLKTDPRNKTPGKDYAPYIEFNGTPTTAPGTLTYAVFSHQREIRDTIHTELGMLIRSLSGGKA